MKIDDRVNNMRITLSIVGFNVDLMSAEMVCQINDLLNKKKGLTTLRDIKKIEVNLLAKYSDIENQIREYEQPMDDSE